MSEHPSLTRLWFMDWHGWVLSHDPVQDFFSPAPFKPGIHPGVSALVPASLELPHDVFFEKRVSMPRPFPKLEMLPAPDGLVYFRMKEQNTYLKSDPASGKGQIVTDSRNKAGWERFLPMTADLLRGLSTMIVPQAATLTDTQSGETFPLLQLRSGFIGDLGGKRMSLTKSIQAIEQLGRLQAGHKADISFHEEGSDIPFIVSAQRPN